MALDVQYLKPAGDDGEWFEVTTRLALTEDGRVVPESDPDARWLYAVPGRLIPKAEALKHGLVAATDEKPRRRQKRTP